MRIVGMCLLTVVRIVALILTIPLMLLSVSIEIVGKWVSLFASLILIGNLAIIMSIFGFMTALGNDIILQADPLDRLSYPLSSYEPSQSKVLASHLLKQVGFRLQQPKGFYL